MKYLYTTMDWIVLAVHFYCLCQIGHNVFLVVITLQSLTVLNQLGEILNVDIKEICLLMLEFLIILQTW